ncbi:hypothetical protein Kisp01_18710 [Kineosporia sp. NBRC 101677]|nr:hypothetical protein Kisp01_18710 [Kineosporia sp. NBRC 101677]
MIDTVRASRPSYPWARPAGEGWEPLILQRDPAVAVALRTTTGLRLVVCEAQTEGDADRLRSRVLDRAMAVAGLSELAEELRRDPDEAASGVAVADLSDDGLLTLLVHDAPPALLLSPGRPARLLGDMGARRQIGERLSPADLLIVNSAGALERPSGLLGAISTRVPTGPEIEHVLDALVARPGAGATVCLRRHV